jgi:hypothetical protein
MRAFACAACDQLVFFENTACLHCGAELAFAWPEREMQTFPASAPPPRCANARVAGCNWLVGEAGELCASCRLTRTRPPDGDAAGLAALARAEAAKRHLLFELGELGIRIDDRLTFDLLSSEHEPVTTGHADGVVTLDLAESDDAYRERVRVQMGEPYRTLLGHFRHEVGHYTWTVLAPDEDRRERARAYFGDERADYAAALERHYEQGPPADWEQAHVSAYATVHPAEDWAETFAHYLHIRDTLQTAAAYRMSVQGPEASWRDLASRPRADAEDFDELLDAWLPLTYALNAINRSMGRQDLYPFVLSGPVVAKLALVHHLVAAAATSPIPAS